ncbi:hypothetical protein [Sphingomonas sp.]|uniref:hypothetical protein n=1 Tax=Sphingomonas sp. TaxID=28214 RepID=UPI003CC6B548
MADPPKVFDFTLLMPRIQLNLWTLALDAKTDAVAIAWKPGQFTTALKYNYGGAIQASMAVSGQSLSLSLDPALMQPTAQMVLKGYDFTAAASASPTALGLTIGYGAAPLPTPATLGPAINGAWSAAGRMWGDAGMIPRDPLGYLKLHSNDPKALAEAYQQTKKIAEVDPNKVQVGAGFSFTRKPGGPDGKGPEVNTVLIQVWGSF